MRKRSLTLVLSVLFIILCFDSVPACALAAGGEESSAGGEYTEIEETFSETVTGGGLAIYASPGPQFRLFSTFSASSFPGSYGKQLTGEASKIYNAMEGYFVNNKGTGKLELGTSVEISCGGTGNWETSAGYAGAKEQLSYAVTSAYCALLYDHPELFWAYSMNYSWTVSATNNGNNFTATIKNIQVSFTETYAGAKQSIAAFDAAVDSAVNAIKSRRTSAMKDQTLKAIHDYVCERITYPANYNLNNIVPAYHSAAGMFLNVSNGYGVCECYAKSFQILCQEFDIKCVLIVGMAGEAHMWNYVQMDDGNWYLVDATWDDQTIGISDVYFLAGSQSSGFNSTPIYQERTVYTRFTDSANTKSFAVPVLSNKKYPGSSSSHTHEWMLKDSKEATCKEDGYWHYICNQNGCNEESTIKTSEPHKYGEYTSDNNATCQKDGTKTRRCIVCGAAGGTITDAGSKRPHSFGPYVSNNDATYTHDGTKTAYCIYGCGTKDTIADVGSILTVPPAAAIASSSSGKATSAPSSVVSAAPSGLSVSSVKSLVLQGNQSTSALQVGKTVSGDSITHVESLNKKLVKVSASGKIRALKKSGTAKLRITLASGATMTVKVKLQSGTVKTKKITGVPKNLTLGRGASVKLSPTLSPITSQQKLSYSTSDKKVVTVTSSGKLKAKKKGRAVISVKSGSKTVKCTVTVN